MTNTASFRRIASRAAANLVAVLAVTAIFGLKAYIDGKARAGHPAGAEAHAFPIGDARQDRAPTASRIAPSLSGAEKTMGSPAGG